MLISNRERICLVGPGMGLIDRLNRLKTNSYDLPKETRSKELQPTNKTTEIICLQTKSED